MRLAHLAAVVLAAASPSLAQSPAATAQAGWRERLASAIQNAVRENPDIRAMESRVQAARHRVPQATALPDTEVEVGIKDIPPSSLSLTRDDFTMEMLAARQRFPGAGKLAGGRRAAQAELSGRAAEHSRHVVEVSADVAGSFFRLAEIDRRIAIVEETRRRLEDAVASARERYRVGKGAQADVLRADLEKTALADRFASLGAARLSEAARFNALQNRPAKAEVPPIVMDTDVEAAGAWRPVPAAEELLRKAEQASPAVAEARAGIRLAEERLNLARLERRPDWMLSGYWGRRQKFEDLAGLSVSFNLPWTHPKRLEERRAEMQAELEAARADLAAVENGLRREIEQAYAELEKNREQVRLFRDSILPQAEINYRAAREAYTVGSVDFLTYVRAATDLDAYQAEMAERVAGTGRALAALQKASGLPLIEGTPGLGDGEKHADE